MRFFTSDLHFGSANINKYARRPFTDAVDALNKLVFNINDNLEARDTLIHVGDFMLSGADRHDKVHDTGLDYKLSDYVGMLKPNALILLAGNHDDGHNCETAGKMMVIDLNQNWRNVTVGHYPSYAKGYCGFKGTEMNAHVHLCGHVHDKWLVCWDEKNHVMNINVGCDVWDYKPVRDAEITEMLDYMWNGKVRAPDQMDREMYETWKLANEKHLEADRIFRKQARYAKKGLTPEICQMRKEEALRKKGLI